MLHIQFPMAKWTRINYNTHLSRLLSGFSVLYTLWVLYLLFLRAKDPSGFHWCQVHSTGTRTRADARAVAEGRDRPMWTPCTPHAPGTAAKQRVHGWGEYRAQSLSTCDFSTGTCWVQLHISTVVGVFTGVISQSCRTATVLVNAKMHVCAHTETKGWKQYVNPRKLCCMYCRHSLLILHSCY